MRWFYAPDYERKGPVPLDQLVQDLLALREPRGCLVWRRGLAMWTRAGEVDEVEGRLARFIVEPGPISAPPTGAPAPRAEPLPAATAAAATVDAAASIEDIELTAPIESEPSVLSRPTTWGAVAVLFAALALGVWSMRGSPSDPGAGRAVAPSARAAAPVGEPGDAPVAAPADPAQAEFAGWAEVEADLPSSERAKLRGVAAWSGNELTITLYNGSAWRVTELFVLTSRLEAGDFVDSKLPNVLVPPQQALDSGVANMLDKVAPDRKKAGLNPLDTGPFSGAVGVQPEAYRWKIEGARGYPPRMR